MNNDEQERELGEIVVIRQLVTPEVALKWLSRPHPLQRKAAKHTVKGYVQDLRAGNWLTNPHPICLDDQERLLDGLHRCMAIVESGISAWCFVAENVPEKSFLVMGLQRPRRAGQFLDGGAKESLAVRVIKAYEDNNGDLSSMRKKVERYISEQDVIDYRPKCPEIIQFFELAKQAGTKAHIAVGDNLALMCLIARHSFHSELVFSWAEALSEGEGLLKGDPRHTLRERFVKDHRILNTQRYHQYRWILLVKAWNAYARKDLMFPLQLRSTLAVDSVPPRIL